MSVQWKPVLGGLVFLLVGLAVGGAVSYSEYQDYQVRDEIRETTAEFTHGTVERDRRMVGDTRQTVYNAYSYYEYTVDGTRYEGRQFGWYNSRAKADRAVERIRTRDPLTVYYHPDSPAESSTTPPGGDLAGALLGIGLGGIFAVVGLKDLLKGIRGNASAD